MKYQVIPYVREGEGWNLKDDVLKFVWLKLLQSHKAEKLFYDGWIRNEEQFMAWLKDPGNLVCFLMDMERKQLCMVAWLNGLKDGVAMCHFCVLTPYHKGMGEAIIDYWKSWEDENGPILKVIIGVTPETYAPALKMIQMVGMKIIGTIPKFCNLVYEMRRVGGVVSHFCPEGG